MTKFKLIIFICLLLCLVESYDTSKYNHPEANPHRELRRGGGGRSGGKSGGGSRSKYYSKYSRMSSKSYTRKKYSYGRSYVGFYQYYLPANYYDPIGYYSPLYL